MTSFDSDQDGFSLGESFADLLTKVDKISLEKIVTISSELNCPRIFGGVISLLNHDLGIDSKLILNDLETELARLKAVGEEIPDIETYLYNFSITEGKWIAYLRGSTEKILTDDVKKLKPLMVKLSKAKGKDLIPIATQILMERQFIAANLIIPVIERWVEEHKEASELDIAIRILAAYFGKPISDEFKHKMVKTKQELFDQIQMLGDILASAEQSNWIIRALIEAEILHEDMAQELEEITYKGLADIIIWIIFDALEKQAGDYTIVEDISKMIVRFQLESELGLKKASPLATLEYNLLHLNMKDDLAKPKLAEEMIIISWKEARLSGSAMDIAREILALLMDHSVVTAEFASKVPRHFDYVIDHYRNDRLRLVRALERIKIKGKEATDNEKREAIILDYLVQYVVNYILGKSKADVKDLEVPEDRPEIELTQEQRDIIEMIDATLQRGIRAQDKRKALEIFDAQILSQYQRLLIYVKDEITVGEYVIYGLFNMNAIQITKEDARKLILGHFKRMQVSVKTSGKKRIDSVVRKAISIEIQEKIIERDIS
ncbi:MAG: hypothetical protein ACTSXA_05265 [Candidatus Heimdallarchaeota archaeon]